MLPWKVSHFVTQKGGIASPDGLVFGCSNDNENFEKTKNSSIGGILGTLSARKLTADSVG